MPWSIRICKLSTKQWSSVGQLPSSAASVLSSLPTCLRTEQKVSGVPRVAAVAQEQTTSCKVPADLYQVRDACYSAVTHRAYRQRIRVLRALNGVKITGKILMMSLIGIDKPRGKLTHVAGDGDTQSKQIRLYYLNRRRPTRWPHSLVRNHCFCETYKNTGGAGTCLDEWIYLNPSSRPIQPHSPILPLVWALFSAQLPPRTCWLVTG